MILRRLIWLFMFHVLVVVAFSRDDKDFTRIGVEEGLSQSWVRKITQDAHGFMWFGTKDGLNRYDGRDFRIYRPDLADGRGLGNGSINELYIDRNDELWVCTLSGVYLYDEFADRFHLFEPLGKLNVSTVVNALDGSYWFGSPGGIYHYTPETKALKRYVNDPGNESSLISNLVWNLLEDRLGRLWIGTEKGLCLYDSEIDGFKRLDDQEWVGDTWVQAMFEDYWGRLWIGTAESVFLYELGVDGHLEVEQLLEIRGQVVKVDHEGSMWLGHGSGEGLTVWHIDQDSGALLDRERYNNRLHDSRSLSSDGVYCIHVDNTGSVWIGTYGDGLNYYSAIPKNFKSMKIQQAGPTLDVGEQVNSILIDGTERWIGTERGLVRYDSESNTYFQYKSDKGDESTVGANAVYSIFKDSLGDVWIGAWDGGLSRYVRETDSFIRYKHDPEDEDSISSDNVFSILEDPKGGLWIGTIGGGLNFFDSETGRFKRFIHDSLNSDSINSGYVNDLALDSAGELWVSTYSSLDRFDRETGKFKHFSHTGDPLIENPGDLEVIYIDTLGQFWLGTEIGLILFDPQDEILKHYTTRDGLPNNSIKSISEDRSGNLWITSNYGLSKFVDGMSVPDKVHFINFDRRDGLQENEFVKRSSFVSENGEIWIGGVAGLSWFYPDEIEPDFSLPNVLITDLNILNKKVYPGGDDGVLEGEPYLLDHLKLKYSDSVFSLDFSALQYPNSEDIEYAFILEGFDNDWQYVKGRSSAIYTNIDPGEYVFRVKSSNTDGVWGDNATTLAVSITPPWWMTLWFRLLFVSSVAAFLVFFYRFRVHSLKRSRIALSKSVADRTRELAEAKEVLSEQNEELKIHRTQLVDLVKERTQELETARDKAEVSDRLKSAFIANMSHEIRTPLNAIMGFSQLIAMEAEGRGEYHEYSSSIRENTDMLVQLLNDIIDFSIFESEQLQLKYESIDGWGFFHELSADFAQLVDSRTPEEVCYLPDNQLRDGVMVRFDADKVRLRQILLNLATNACKFTESGSISFGVAMRDSDQRLEYWVKDSGVGIDPSEHEAIFERFHKIVDSSRSFTRGTGLGLAICQRLSEELGFELSLESEVGKGSVFTVSIPVESDSSKVTRSLITEAESRRS